MKKGVLQPSDQLRIDGVRCRLLKRTRASTWQIEHVDTGSLSECSEQQIYERYLDGRLEVISTLQHRDALEARGTLPIGPEADPDLARQLGGSSLAFEPEARS